MTAASPLGEERGTSTLLTVGRLETIDRESAGLPNNARWESANKLNWETGVGSQLIIPPLSSHFLSLP